VLERIGLDQIQSSGYSFQMETVTRALKCGFSIKETPILFVERAAGASKMSKAIVFESIKMAWRLRKLNMESDERQQARA
jgi:dolichol-phosphate mannosyltransferase